MASEGYHEPVELLPEPIRDTHRAFVSLQEELEAADWYDQRVAAATDEALKRILAHHRDEEKEHAAMLVEWLRRRDPVFEAHLRTYLYTEADIVEIEEASEDGEHQSEGSDYAEGSTAPTLTVGSLID